MNNDTEEWDRDTERGTACQGEERQERNEITMLLG